jgi:hypothetical protein
MIKLFNILIIASTLLFVFACQKEEVYQLEFRDEQGVTIETIETGSVLNQELPLLSKEKYVFLGWVDSDQHIISKGSRIRKNYVLYPVFEDVIVSFYTLTEEKTSINMNEQDLNTYILPFPGYHPGFFMGYYDDHDVLFDENYQFYHHTSFYPKFSPFIDVVIGSDFGDDFFGLDGFLSLYYFLTSQLQDPNTGEIIESSTPVDPYQPFEDFLVEIGGPEMMTEERFIEFLARDLIANSPTHYRNLRTGEILPVDDLPEGFDPSTRQQLFTFTGTGQNLWLDQETGIYYQQSTREINSTSVSVYIETHVLTGVLNEDNVRSDRDGLVTFEKKQNIIRISGGANSGFYVEVAIGGNKDYLRLDTGTILGNSNPLRQNITTEGPIYLIGEDFYEYVEPLLFYNNRYIQLEQTAFTFMVVLWFYDVYSFTYIVRSENDLFRFLNRILMEMYPEKYLTLMQSQAIDYHFAFEDIFTKDQFSFDAIEFWTGFKPIYAKPMV